MKAGTLRPGKQIQDRCVVLNPDGISKTLRATDYKDPIKIAVCEASGIYIDATAPFQRGPLPGLSRTITAQKNDAGVILIE